jgi:phage tail sheath gpL-like
MSGTVTFSKIPSTLLRHGTFVEINSAGNTAALVQRTLIIGQVLSSGALFTAPNLPVISSGAADAKAQGGRGSMLALLTAEYKLADNSGQVWYLPLLDDPNSQAASLSFVVAAGPSVAGTIPLMVAGVVVPVGVSAGQTTAATASAIVAAINLNLDLPVTAAIGGTTSTVVVTAKNKGLAGNDIDLRLAYYGTTGGDVMPTGLVITGLLIATGTQLTGGTQNPTALLTALDNLADQAFDFLVFPYTDAPSLNVWQTFMDNNTGRWSWDRMLYGGGFNGFRGTYGAATAFGVTRNDPAMATLPVYDAPEPSWIWAANIAGYYAVSCRANPAVPFQDIVTDLLPPPIQNRFTGDELETLLGDGLGAYEVIGGQVVINRLPTNYQLDAQGDPDNSYQDVESRYQLTYAARDLKTYLGSLYSRKIWVDDNTKLSGSINNAVAMPSMLKASCISRYRYLEDLGIVQDADAFAAGLVVEKRGSAARIYWDGDLSNQLRQIEIGIFFTKT